VQAKTMQQTKLDSLFFIRWILPYA
jgi:hypothetical protein